MSAPQQVPLQTLHEAESVLMDLAALFVSGSASDSSSAHCEDPSNAETRYRTLIEQIPAIVFLMYLDRGIGEAYVSPQIETLVGMSREQWLEDPVRWYSHLHPDDKQRWSIEAAEMFLTGKPIRSVYRVLARDGGVVWFHCDAKIVRRDDGHPSFIQGVAFDITDWKRAEIALQEERNFISTVLDTVGALVIVLDPRGRIVQLNRAAERLTGFTSAEVGGNFIWDVLLHKESAGFRAALQQTPSSANVFESYCHTRHGDSRLILWECKSMSADSQGVEYLIAAGIDITESKRLEKTILEVSEREQRRIGQELHDGLGQHLTGIAFMAKVLQERLADRELPESVDAAKILQLVNDAIHKTRELSRSLLPVVNVSHGLMSALERWASEVENLFRVSCSFECETPVLIHEDSIANHLFLIAREASTNSIRHGRARHIRILLSQSASTGELSIFDDGSGLPVPNTASRGLGLHIMNYRAKMIGGSLHAQRRPEGGTAITCHFPVNSERQNQPS